MEIRWFKLVITAVVAEIIPIILLIIIVAIFGPGSVQEAELFAEELGPWVGPLGGALATFLLAVWVARSVPQKKILHGILLGVIVAVIDALLLVSGSAEFRLLFLISGLGRILAGGLGGILAEKSARTS